MIKVNCVPKKDVVSRLTSSIEALSIALTGSRNYDEYNTKVKAFN